MADDLKLACRRPLESELGPQALAFLEAGRELTEPPAARASCETPKERRGGEVRFEHPAAVVEDDDRVQSRFEHARNLRSRSSSS